MKNSVQSIIQTTFGNFDRKDAGMNFLIIFLEGHLSNGVKVRYMKLIQVANTCETLEVDTPNKSAMTNVDRARRSRTKVRRNS
jgi:hypothetical protein